jgi:adenosylcobinamide kinase/adenosylcobinamide-phosphate guanylyltransferase
MGIVPENPASRLYRDIAGRCNQIIASHADVVVFMISGLPLRINPSSAESHWM